MKITSPEFDHGGVIPERFSQNGLNHSPPLDFVDVPAAAKSLVLIMDDPDAPRGRFTHWIVFNIDPTARGFSEDGLPDGIRCGRNDAGEAGYAGPKPPDREHRYFLKLYALDTRLAVLDGSTRSDVEDAMNGHIVAEAELMGRYAPPGRANPDQRFVQSTPTTP
jgi:Raf kinase inhibitor-like YbhB/YbcL family protein